MNTSNAEERFNSEWQQYFDALSLANDSSLQHNDLNPKHETYKSYFDDYGKRRFIYEELLKIKSKIDSTSDGCTPPTHLAHWLCIGIERSLAVADSVDETKHIKERIESLESIEQALDTAIKAIKSSERLSGETKLIRHGTPTTVTKELEYLREVSLRPLSNLKADYDYQNQFGQAGREYAKVIRFGKSLALYFYESIGMKMDGTVAHITNAIFPVTTKDSREFLERSNVREWTRDFNWVERDKKQNLA